MISTTSLVRFINFNCRNEHSMIVSGSELLAESGGITVVLGPSGSGKSTLLRFVSGLQPRKVGLERLEAAVSHVAGYDTPAEALRSGAIAFVPQSPTLMPQWNVQMNIENLARCSRECGRATLAGLFEAEEIPSLLKKYPRELSGGMQTRVAIARALSTSAASVLLIDEAFSSLDVDRRRRSYILVRGWVRCAEARRTCIVVTHDLHEALVLGDRIYVVTGGGLVSAKEWDGTESSELPPTRDLMNPDWIAQDAERHHLAARILELLTGGGRGTDVA